MPFPPYLGSVNNTVKERMSEPETAGRERGLFARETERETERESEWKEEEGHKREGERERWRERGSQRLETDLL